MCVSYLIDYVDAEWCDNGHVGVMLAVPAHLTASSSKGGRAGEASEGPGVCLKHPCVRQVPSWRDTVSGSVCLLQETRLFCITSCVAVCASRRSLVYGAEITCKLLANYPNVVHAVKTPATRT